MSATALEPQPRGTQTGMPGSLPLPHHYLSQSRIPLSPATKESAPRALPPPHQSRFPALLPHAQHPPPPAEQKTTDRPSGRLPSKFKKMEEPSKL